MEGALLCAIANHWWGVGKNYREREGSMYVLNLKILLEICGNLMFLRSMCRKSFFSKNIFTQSFCEMVSSCPLVKSFFVFDSLQGGVDSLKSYVAWCVCSAHCSKLSD